MVTNRSPLVKLDTESPSLSTWSLSSYLRRFHTLQPRCHKIFKEIETWLHIWTFNNVICSWIGSRSMNSVRKIAWLLKIIVISYVTIHKTGHQVHQLIVNLAFSLIWRFRPLHNIQTLDLHEYDYLGQRSDNNITHLFCAIYLVKLFWGALWIEKQERKKYRLQENTNCVVLHSGSVCFWKKEDCLRVQL